MDGLDEFFQQGELLESPRASISDEMSVGGVLYNVLKIRLLPNQRTIVTSRPESANLLYLKWGSDLKIKRIEVVGFTQKTA